MVWIYGGGFTVGTIEMYPGQDLAIHGDVIYVAVNYRLSALGFLATGEILSLYARCQLHTYSYHCYCQFILKSNCKTSH